MWEPPPLKLDSLESPPKRPHGSDTDWVGLWYAVAAERGVNHVFTLTLLNVDTGQRRYFDVTHTRFDGVGALGHLLRLRGFDLPTLPAGRGDPSPRLPRLLLDRTHLRELLRPKRVPWHNDAANEPFERHAFALHTYDRDDTAELAAARARWGVSSNALLLCSAHRVLGERFLACDEPADWLFGVNLRGSVRAGASDTANHSTGIPVTCALTTPVTEVHRQLRDKLSGGLQHLFWKASQVGRLVGLPGMRRISRRYEKKSHWMGTFSNMGSWPPPGSDPAPDPDEAWACVPPGTPNYPIGIGLLTWHGRLTLCLKVNHTICPSPRILEDLLTQACELALAWARNGPP